MRIKIPVCEEKTKKKGAVAVLVIGVDIGGTKCAVSLGEVTGERVQVLHKCAVRATAALPVQKMLEALAGDIAACAERAEERGGAEGIGISCGGPLDSRRGVILSPPNLPGWDEIPIADFFTEKTGRPAFLCNDANACALAEWRLGAGRGCSSMVFLTFGTGLGAGLILNNRLYAGASDMAGEIGHIRLSEYGPVGYGKAGSFEGFCSGGGIAQLARQMILEELQTGGRPALCPSPDGLPAVTAATVGAAAKQGDPLAREILRRVGAQLGKGLSFLMDTLNPERIVIGSIFVRSHEEIWPAAKEVIERETLPQVRAACRVVPSALTESVGDVAALMVAEYNLREEKQHERANGTAETKLL